MKLFYCNVVFSLLCLSFPSEIHGFLVTFPTRARRPRMFQHVSISTQTNKKNNVPNRRVTLHSTMKNTTEESKDITITTTTSSSLLPEYEKAKSAVLSSLPTAFNNNPKIITPISHFVNEYFTACNQAKLQNSPWSTSPRMTSYHALKAMKLGIKASGQLRRKKNEENEEGAFQFGVAHKSMRGFKPEEENGNTFDYYRFGCNFFRPVIDVEHSVILGQERIEQIWEQVQNGDNIVFFANHQTEPDPQVISILLENIGYGQLAENIMYVAGHKVTTDPVAIPFSMGNNLLCIHSKKHKNTDEGEDEAKRRQKQKQNLDAMSTMLRMLKKGRAILWVAPSGGRDRRNITTGEIPIAPFDSKTIDMFRLMGEKSNVATHYYPLAMRTYENFPPPDCIVSNVGERRNIRFGPVGIGFAEELDNCLGRHLFDVEAEESCRREYELLVDILEAKKEEKGLEDEEEGGRNTGALHP